MRDVDSHSVLMSLAAVLKVEVTELTGDQPTESQPTSYTAAREIERAMMAYDSLDSVSPRLDPHIALTAR